MWSFFECFEWDLEVPLALHYDWLETCLESWPTADDDLEDQNFPSYSRLLCLILVTYVWCHHGASLVRFVLLCVMIVCACVCIVYVCVCAYQWVGCYEVVLGKSSWNTIFDKMQLTMSLSCSLTVYLCYYLLFILPLCQVSKKTSQKTKNTPVVCIYIFYILHMKRKNMLTIYYNNISKNDTKKILKKYEKKIHLRKYKNLTKIH